MASLVATKGSGDGAPGTSRSRLSKEKRSKKRERKEEGRSSSATSISGDKDTVEEATLGAADSGDSSGGRGTKKDRNERKRSKSPRSKTSVLDTNHSADSLDVPSPTPVTSSDSLGSPVKKPRSKRREKSGRTSDPERRTISLVEVREAFNQYRLHEALGDKTGSSTTNKGSSMENESLPVSSEGFSSDKRSHRKSDKLRATESSSSKKERSRTPPRRTKTDQPRKRTKSAENRSTSRDTKDHGDSPSTLTSPSSKDFSRRRTPPRRVKSEKPPSLSRRVTLSGDALREHKPTGESKMS